MNKTKKRRQPPIDPRLWRASQSARRYLVLSVVVGFFIGVQVIVVAWCIATIASGIITDPTTRHISAWTLPLCILAVMIVLRAITGWVQDRYAHRSAGRVVLDLRLSLLRAATHTNPRTLAAHRDELRTISTSGLDGLPPYLISYIPSLMLASTVTPMTWLAIVLADPTSGIIIALTIPLIPIFMILVGMLTEERTRRYLESMTRLSSTILDLIAGLPTLISIGREKAPGANVRKVGEKHFAATMASLRIAFLSSAVLELLATLCIAIVAASLGFRLLGYSGEVQLFNAIFVLILVADVYKPLREVGSKFHDSEDGQHAASRAFAAIDLAEELGKTELDEESNTLPTSLTFTTHGLTIESRGTYAPAGLNCTVQPGQITVLTGANGAGKSTTLLTLMGMPGMLPGETGVSGSATVNGRPVDAIPVAHLWERINWLPQRPALTAGTVRDNLAIPTTAGTIQLDEAAIAEAAHETGFDHVVKQLPEGYDTWLGAGGLGISLGQRQRLALTRILADDTKHTLILDEPTAHLDGDSEDRVIQHLRQRADQGDTILIIGHRDRLLAAADVVIPVYSDDKEKVTQ